MYNLKKKEKNTRRSIKEDKKGDETSVHAGRAASIYKISWLAVCFLRR